MDNGLFAAYGNGVSFVQETWSRLQIRSLYRGRNCHRQVYPKWSRKSQRWCFWRDLLQRRWCLLQESTIVVLKWNTLVCWCWCRGAHVQRQLNWKWLNRPIGGHVLQLSDSAVWAYLSPKTRVYLFVAPSVLECRCPCCGAYGDTGEDTLAL